MNAKRAREEAEKLREVDSLCFYRAMLCIRGTSHGPVSVCVCVCVCLSVCHKSAIGKIDTTHLMVPLRLLSFLLIHVIGKCFQYSVKQGVPKGSQPVGMNPRGGF